MINAAKNNLHIMYCGTSYSTQTVDGILFAVTFNGDSADGALDIHYRPSKVYDARDLSHDGVDADGHMEYFHKTVKYLLDNFEELINMYAVGGLKGRTRANAVTFVFMTGSAQGSDGDIHEPSYLRSPYQNHKS